MTTSEQNFFNILSAAIWNKPVELLEPVDYDAVLRVAARHQLLAVVYEKLCESGNFKKDPVFKNAQMEVILTVIGQTQKTVMFLNLYKKLNKNNIYPIVMKGILCRQLYGKYADHRPSSDEDILVTKEDFYKTCDILVTEGYEYNQDPKNVDLNEIQAVSFIDKNGSHIEVHVNPIGKGNKLSILMDSYFHDVFKNSIFEDINGTKIKSMSYTNHFLFLIFHAYRHFIGSGFGVRQVVDLLLFEREYEDKIDWNYIKAALKKTNAESFFADLVSIGNTYLGFDLPLHSKNCCPNELLFDLMSNGIFGNDSNAKIMAGTMTSMAVKNSKEKNIKNGSIIKSIFPSKKYMLRDNPELSEKPWRLPIAWAQRWGRFIKRNKSNGGNLAKESMDIGNRRIELLKKYGIVK